MASLRQIITQTQLLSGSVAEALAAVYRTILAGLERNLAGVAALGANCVEHLTGITLATVSLKLSAALAASLGLMLKALLCVKLLRAGGEYEFLIAVFADQCLVCVHSIPLSFRAWMHYNSIIIQCKLDFVNPFCEIGKNFFHNSYIFWSQKRGDGRSPRFMIIQGIKNQYFLRGTSDWNSSRS